MSAPTIEVSAGYVQSVANYIRTDWRRSAHAGRNDEIAYGKWVALWFFNFVSDEEYYGLINECRFLLRRAHERERGVA